MVAVKTGLAPPPMMPNQPMNMMPPPMPVPALNQPMPMQQGAAPVPVNARRRKRFGDSLENMLSRPPMVASDQMGDMNVFTGQMMNTAARPPVVRMRGGGIVRNMRRGGGMNFEPGRGSIYDTYSPPKPSKPNKPTVSKASQIVANQIAQAQKDNRPSYDFSVSPGDDKPPPVVTAPVVPMDFGDDDDYTPTAAELNQQLANQGLTDLRSDTSVVPDFDMIRSGSDIMNPDRRDEFNQDMVDRSARIAARNMRSAGGFSDVELPRDTGGIAAIRSRQPFPDELSLQTPFNNTPSFPDELVTTPFNNANVTPTFLPDELVTQPFNNANVTPTYLPDELITEPFNSANVTPVSLPDELTGVPFNNLGLGNPDATSGGAGGGQTGTGTGEEDDRGIVQKIIDDFAAVPGNIMRDLRMGIDAGFYTDFEVARKRLMDTGKYTKAEVDSWVQRTKDTAKENQRKMSEQQGRDDDDSPMSTSPVDPCPPGFKLDPVSGICVPVEEAEEEGPSLDLNRTRDDEFNELDDIMKKIVKPIGERDEVRTMQAGGSVGLNRVADNFLAAMGG